MYPIQQQLAAAGRIQFETQLTWYNTLGQTALDSMEKLMHLNVAAARASMEESAATARQALHARDPQEILRLVRAQTGPNFGKAIAYSNHLVNIATNAQAELARVAEEQVAEVGRRAGEMVDEVARVAPPGVDSVLVVMKSAIGKASNGYAQMNKTTRQAVVALENNSNAAVNQIVQPTPDAASQ
jgi:phasin family protein